jgi:hypothetical protein
VNGRRGSDPVLVACCAVAALVGGVVAVAVLGSVRDIDRPALVAALVGVAVLFGVLTAALAPAGSAPADPTRSGAGSRAAGAAPGRGLAGTASAGRGAAGSGSAGTAPAGRGAAGSAGHGSAGTASAGRGAAGSGSAGTASDGRDSGDSATGGSWWTAGESGSAEAAAKGRGSAGSRPAAHSGGATPRRGTEPPEPDDGFSWAGRSGSGGPEPAGGTRQWWTEPRTAATPESGPLVPALDLPEHPAETRIVQCTSCGDERVDVRHESAGGFAFDCGACGHHWSWQAGAPWPVAVVRPRLRRPAGPTTR